MTSNGAATPRVLIAAALLYLAFIARTAFVIGHVTYFSLLDDGMISMRYARNLAGGHGLVWNAGGTPVEGYSNFLWTVWMALIHLVAVPASKVSLLVMLSGVAILIANGLIVKAILAKLLPSDESFGTVLGIAMVAFCYSLMFWTLRGMEVGLVVLLVDAACYFAFLLRDDHSPVRAAGFCVCLGALTLVREDAIASAALIAGFAMIGAWRSRRFGLMLAAAAALLVPPALHITWRLHYYGAVLPNTYYLKMTGVASVDRIEHGVTVALAMAARSLVLPLGLIALAFAKGPRSRAKDERLWLLAALAVVNITYSAYVGGDVWDWMQFPNRFATIGLVPLLILAAVAADLIWTEARDPQERVRSILGLCAAALALSALADLADKATGFGIMVSPAGSTATIVTLGLAIIVGLRLRREAPNHAVVSAFGRTRWIAIVLMLLVLDGRALGQWALRNALALPEDVRVARLGVFLHDATQPDATIAVAYAGAIPYFADRFSLDITGKNDPVIARETGKGPFRPGLNKWDYPYTILTFTPDVVADAAWASDELVRRLPEWGYVGLPNGVFVRRDDRRVEWNCLGLDWHASDAPPCSEAANVPSSR